MSGHYSMNIEELYGFLWESGLHEMLEQLIEFELDGNVENIQIYYDPDQDILSEIQIWTDEVTYKTVKSYWGDLSFEFILRHPKFASESEEWGGWTESLSGEQTEEFLNQIREENEDE